MKILIAPQGFKGSLDAGGVAAAIADGVRRVWPDAELEIVPMADGGEGTVRALVEATDGELRTAEVSGPLGERVAATWGLLGDRQTAVIEMAAASGLPLVTRGRRNPMVTTTFGTGELIRAALDAGCRRFVVGIGGSATNDGGAGMAQALGVRLLDAAGKDLYPGGGALAGLSRIDVAGLDPRIRESTFDVACDVTNPLTGPTGASAVYGPQKGATPEMVRKLDAALAHYAEILRRDLGADVAQLPGAGAAGGLGAGVIAFLGARLRRGVDLVIDAVGLRARLPGTNLVFTGEGRIDTSTVFGKTPVGVAGVAKEAGLPVIAVAGTLGKGYQAVYQHGIDAIVAIAPGPMSLDEAFRRSADLTADATERAIRLLATGQSLPPSLQGRGRGG